MAPDVGTLGRTKGVLSACLRRRDDGRHELGADLGGGGDHDLKEADQADPQQSEASTPGLQHTVARKYN